MRVLDPQSALLTTSEVHEFLARNPPRPRSKKIGSYAPVNLKGYQRIRDDFEEYISSTVPYIANYPPPETFVKNLVPKLRAFGLSKTEVFMMINLGLGLARQQPQQTANENRDANSVAVNGEAEVATVEDNDSGNDNEEQPNPAEEGQEEPYQPSDMELVSCVVEELEDRFPGDKGREQIQKILEAIKEEYVRAHSTHASTNGDTNGNVDAMDVS